jgi:hypothetical protein
VCGGRAGLRYVFVLGICWMMIPLVGSQIFFGVLRATGASLGLFPCEDETFAKATDIVHERCVRRPPPPPNTHRPASSLACRRNHFAMTDDTLITASPLTACVVCGARCDRPVIG